MEDARTLLVATCSSLARPQMRLLDLLHSWRRLPNGNWDRSPHWCKQDIDPASPWLDACPNLTALSGIISAIALVQAHLLAMIEAKGPIDGRMACIVLHHLSLDGCEWSTPVRRLANLLDVQLGASPRDDTHGLSLHHRPLPRRRESNDETCSSEKEKRRISGAH